MSTRRRVMLAACGTVGAALLAVGPLAAVSPASASGAVTPVVFAAAPGGATKPDDITRLGSLFYVTYQNNAGKDGTPAGSRSTVVAFSTSGSVVATYSIAGRVDGLTADPGHNRVFATANEDLNSSLFVIQPGVATAVQYRYSPDPGLVGGKLVNGGTDAISIGSDGTAYVAHSNPDPSLANPPAVYTLTLSGNTAHLSGVFGVNDKAPTALGLTDPDSNRIIPGAGGDTLIQVAQADSQFVIATNLHSSTPTLRQLKLTNAAATSSGKPASPQLDDVVQVTGPGTLYVVDQGGGSIYTIDTATVTPGTFFVSQPKPSTGDLPNDPAIGTVNIDTGVVSHVNTTLKSPKGLLFVPTANPTLPKTGAPQTQSVLRVAALFTAAGVVSLVAARGRRRPL